MKKLRQFTCVRNGRTFTVAGMRISRCASTRRRRQTISSKWEIKTQRETRREVKQYERREQKERETEGVTFGIFIFFFLELFFFDPLFPMAIAQWAVCIAQSPSTKRHWSGSQRRSRSHRTISTCWTIGKERKRHERVIEDSATETVRDIEGQRGEKDGNTDRQLKRTESVSQGAISSEVWLLQRGTRRLQQNAPAQTKGTLHLFFLMFVSCSECLA